MCISKESQSETLALAVILGQRDKKRSFTPKTKVSAHNWTAVIQLFEAAQG